MIEARDTVMVLYLVGGVATAAALVTSVVSIALSVRAASRRPYVAAGVNERFQARRAELNEPLEEAQRQAVNDARPEEVERFRTLMAAADLQVLDEFAAEFSRHGMVPHTWDNIDVQPYAESAWQVQQSLRPQVVSAVLLVAGIALQTWASIGALSLPPTG